MHTVPSSPGFNRTMPLTLWYYNAIYKPRCHQSTEQRAELKMAFIKTKIYCIYFKGDKNISR